MSKATTLDRETILGKTKLRTERVDVPEWGGVVNVKELTGAERDSFEASIVDLKSGGRELDSDNVRAKLAVRAVVDDNGARIFEDSDAVELGNLSAAPLSRVYNVAARLAGLTAEDLEELAGN